MLDEVKVIAALQEYHDRDWTDERMYPNGREYRKRVTGDALDLIKRLQRENDWLTAKVRWQQKTAGDNNVPLMW